MKNTTRVFLMFCTVFLVLVFLYKIIQITNANTYHDTLMDNELPPMVMIDENLYQLEDVTNTIPRSEPDGKITEIILNQVPDKNELANFGEINMEYWNIDNHVFVKLNENVLKFKKIEHNTLEEQE